MTRRIVCSLVIAAIAVALLPAAADAERAAGATSANQLVTFDTATPDVVSMKAITGLATPGERVLGVDWRPATGELFAVTVPIGSAASPAIRTYSVNLRTAQASQVGSAIPGLVPGAGDYLTGIDFNPLVDRIRVVNANNDNFRVNPNNGALSGDDPNLAYTAPATGPVVAVAYDRNVAPGPPSTPPPPTSRTTLYGIDRGANRLVLQGGIDGSPSPNLGAITSVGELGVTLAGGSDAGFDISPGGTAYAALQPTGLTTDKLYTINLATGAATEVGSLPAVLNSLTILPPDNCPDLDGDDQTDLDGDGLGDACDTDDDGDGVLDTTETANGGNPRSADADGDGKGDAADACPATAAATANGCADPPAPPPPPVVDRTAPKLTVASLTTKLTYKAFLKGVSFKLTPDEQAAFEIKLLAKGSRATVARAGDIVLGEKNFRLAAGTRTVKLKPVKRLIGRKRKFNVRVEIRATDATGNRVVSTRTVKITG